MSARVVVLAGPSGAGKTRLAARAGLPVLRLDDFYKSGDDPSLPRIARGPDAGRPDWDDPASWSPADALAAIEALCRDGVAEVPVYDLTRDAATGRQRLDLAGSTLFLAEGIFAQEVVPECRTRGLLAAAYCVRQHRLVTFWRRLVRDLREHRKPPPVLVRRGLVLLRDQARVVRHAVDLGCSPVTPAEARRRIRALAHRPSGLLFGVRLPQPDRVSCGAAVVVASRWLADGGPADERVWSLRARFGAEVQQAHRRLTEVRDGRGRLQVPWPRTLGTPPWAVARALGNERSGFTARLVRPRWGRRRRWRELAQVVASGRPVPLYVGSRWLPRHVVLATSRPATGSLHVYEPGRGVLVEVTEEAFRHGRLDLGGWTHPWWQIVPRRATTPSTTRRIVDTPAAGPG